VGGLDEVFRHADVVVTMQQVRSEDRPLFMAMKPEQICIDLARTLGPGQVSGEYRTVDNPQRESALVNSSAS
jgi:hypothetical protein